jgi:signal transduction histidine kinase
VKRVGFRTRLFIILALFAVIPSAVLVFAGAPIVGETIQAVGSSAPWRLAEETGREVIATMRSKPLTAEERAQVDRHEAVLERSGRQSGRLAYLVARAPAAVGLIALVGVLIVGLIASRVAGHLSRQLSRPLQELVGWTERIARGESLPQTPARRGAPEFEMLRQRMRRMAREIAQGRARDLEAERLRAFRETARQVAHELKNPLTPIRFAVDRLRQDVPPHLRETVDVLSTEARRLEEMARSFAQFGRLSEGPPSDIELGELVRYSATATVPPGMPLTVSVEENLPMIHGHHDALARAVSNVLINAVDACRDGGSIAVRVGRTTLASTPAVEISVRDTGCGIPAEHLDRIWEPYVTHKTGGTGLGLAIARQTIAAHGGEVAATSTPGDGTEIRFVLPIAPTPASTDVVLAGQMTGA